MNTGRDDDQTWAELVDAFHNEPERGDDAPRWPDAENVDPRDNPKRYEHPAYGPSSRYGAEPPGASPEDGPNDEADAAEDEPTEDHEPPVERPVDPYPGTSRTLGELSSGFGGHGGPRSWRPAEPGDTNVADDHFIPPDPPPIPRGDRITRWAWTGLIAAPSILLLSSLIDWSPPTEFMALVVGGFIAGFVTLVARMRGRNPHDPDDGAVV